LNNGTLFLALIDPISCFDIPHITVSASELEGNINSNSSQLSRFALKYKWRVKVVVFVEHKIGWPYPK
jgi:hypothetical protein